MLDKLGDALDKEVLNKQKPQTKEETKTITPISPKKERKERYKPTEHENLRIDGQHDGRCKKALN